MQFKTLLVEETSITEFAKVIVLKINRPEAMNALNQQVLEDLRECITQLKQVPNLRALVLTGQGEKSFVAGADIKEMEGLNADQGRQLAQAGQVLFQRLRGLPFPVIAAVNGFALGGGLELALACDFILASSKMKWGLPEVTLGLIPGYGGTQRLLRAIGPANARRVALSGEIFSAQQGYEWGLISQVIEPEQLLPTALQTAKLLAQRAPLAVTWVKEAMEQGIDLSTLEGLEVEADLFGRTFETQDRREGVAAFIEKRQPGFVGK